MSNIEMVWALLVGAFIGLILIWVGIAWWDNFHG